MKKNRWRAAIYSAASCAPREVTGRGAVKTNVSRRQTRPFLQPFPSFSLSFSLLSYLHRLTFQLSRSTTGISTGYLFPCRLPFKFNFWNQEERRMRLLSSRDSFSAAIFFFRDSFYVFPVFLSLGGVSVSDG